MFETHLAAVAAARTAVDGVRACARLENAACAARLGHMADILATAHSADGSAEREQWRFDNWAAVCAQIGAAHDITSGIANGLLTDAVVLRERLPQVAAVFATGAITYRLVHQICTRTMLVKDLDALAALDEALAEMVTSCGAMSSDQAEKTIDALVLTLDPFAIRRTQTRNRSHRVDVHVDDASGTAHIDAVVSVTDGHAFDQRLDALARTVCDRDPRDHVDRRAAAVGAMGFGWDRLPCLCDSPDCDAASTPPVGGIVIHVVAHAETLDGSGGDTDDPDDRPAPDDRDPSTDADADADAEVLAEPTPGTDNPSTAHHDQPHQVRPAVILGGAVVPPAVIARAAIHATIRPLIHPGQASPEPRYRPSKALTEFVRCRDQTCRFPGCTRPATITDIDHTVPHPWGPTAASNLACLCREH